MQHLISVPPRMVSHFHSLTGLSEENWFVSCDPGEQKVGSGGGTAHLLAGLFEKNSRFNQTTRLASYL